MELVGNQSLEFKEKRLGCIRQSTFHSMWFAYVYFAQGFFNSYDLVAPLYLTDNGISTATVGLVGGISHIPVTIRIPLCILSDKFYISTLGRRRPYVFLGLFVSGMCYLGLGFLTDAKQNLVAYVFVLFVAKCGFVLYDGVLDGFATEVTPPKDVGKIQGIMNCSRGLSIILASILFGYLSDNIGWIAVFLCTAFILFGGTPWIPWVREPQKADSLMFQWKALQSLRQTECKALIFSGCMSAMSGGILLLMTPLYIREYFEIASKARVGLYLGIGAIGFFAGAGFSGWFIDRHRTMFRWSFWLYSFLGVITNIGFIALSPSAKGVLFIFTFTGGAAAGVALATNLSMAMLLCDPSVASSFLGIIVTVLNVAGIAGQMIGGVILQAVGFKATYAITLCLWVLVIPGSCFINITRVLERQKAKERVSIKLSEHAGSSHIEVSTSSTHQPVSNGRQSTVSNTDSRGDSRTQTSTNDTHKSPDDEAVNHTQNPQHPQENSTSSSEGQGSSTVHEA